MKEIIPFLRYFFLPTGQPWYSGGVWGNQLQWTLVWLPTLIVMYRKKWECSEKGCWRLGHHPVKGTHYKTCSKHTTKEIHGKLHKHHKLKHPKAHEFLN